MVERGGGGGGDTAEVGEWWWWSRTNEFVCSRCVCAFPAKAAYATWWFVEKPRQEEQPEAVWKCLCNDYVKLLANAVPVVF